MIRTLLILALFAVQMCGMAYANENPVRIRLSTQTPPSMPVMQVLAHFKERVEAESKGAITVEIHDSGKLYSDDQIGKALTGGAVEMGYVNLAQYANIVPGVDIFQLPFVFNSDGLLEAARAPGSEIRAIVDEALLAEAGARALFWVSQGQMVFLSSGKPVSDPGTIEGKIVRAAGPVSEALVAQCGGVPKKIQVTDMPRVYEQRELDVGQHAVVTVAGYKLWSAFDTLTRSNHSSAQYVVAVNEKFWRGLTKQQQDILTAAARAADAEAASQTASNEAKAYQLIAASRMKVAELSKDDLMLWRICSSDVLTEFMQRTGKRGEELMTAYGRLRQQPCCSMKEQDGNTVAALRGR